ncbi:MAG TPA: hypothetical protein VN636_13375, partial [Acidimicrobiia bacterium]|nr:hypothetical protein [Acidimicrobiia bacterium]
GALPLLDPSDVLVAIGRGGTIDGGWDPAPPAIGPDQRAVLKAIAGEAASIDEIEQRAALPPDRLGAALRALETRGAIQRRRGLWWPT